MSAEPSGLIYPLERLVGRALTSLAQGRQEQLVSALQGADPEGLERLLLDILSEGPVDPAVTGALRSAALHLAAAVQDPAAQRRLRRAHASASVALFDSVGVRQRRQILRWLMHDYGQSNASVDAVLRAALADPDWEVRVTALLAAARLRAASVGDAVRGVELPQTSKQALDRTDRDILRALRDTALALLSGERPPEDPDVPPTTPETMRAHLLCCVAGMPATWHDRVFLLTLSLTRTAHPPYAVAPESLPGGIVLRESRYCLERTGIEMIWVPPVQHWLGAESGEFGQARAQAMINPIRPLEPAAGFFISRRPLTQGQLPRHSAGAAAPDEYALCSWADALAACAEISAREGVPLALPGADAWEMAARGWDGRRFPWGNGLDADARVTPSPWGGLDMMGVIAQWTGSGEVPERPLLCGGPDQPHVALRYAAAPDVAAGLRIVRYVA